MKNIFAGLKIVALFAILLFSSFLIYFIFFNKSDKNFIGDKNINLGIGWKNNESNYGGSELGFIFNKSDHISFSLDTNSQADEGVEILIDKKSYVMQSPNLSNQKLTISVDNNKSHSVVIRHFCAQFNYPCTIHMNGIYLSGHAKLWSASPHTKIISILGDSISTIYGNDNYSYRLATDIGYELHDASTVGETVTNVKGYKNAINAVDKDILSFKSDIVLIFLGTNDVSNNISPDQFEKDYSAIVEKVKKKTPNIFLVGIMQRKDFSSDEIQNYNDVIKKIADEYNVTFVDSSSWLSSDDYIDDIHPTSESQQKIAENLNQTITPLLK